MDENRFISFLLDNDVDFFVGVPDSYLHGFCCALKEKIEPDNNMIVANEGNAIGVATGHYLSSGRVPLVYMQNSGLGNAINPLASLACPPMLGIPMILLIGWRGDPFHEDHIQHELQGEITPDLLKLLNIPFRTLKENCEGELAELITIARDRKCPVAILSPKGMLNGTKSDICDNSYSLSREEAINVILSACPKDSIFSATTGRAARELYHAREARQECHSYDFLNVGSMGHASSVALGIALDNPRKRVVCLDGDAALIMHMGALAIIPTQKANNYLHIVLNNGAHESVGNQQSVGWNIDFTSIAEACGYRTVGHFVSEPEEIISSIKSLCSSNCPAFLDVRIHSGMRNNIPPLEIDPTTMRDELMRTLRV